MDKLSKAIDVSVKLIEPQIELIKELREDKANKFLVSKIKWGIRSYMNSFGDIQGATLMSKKVYYKLIEEGISLNDFGGSWHKDRKVLGKMSREGKSDRWALAYEHCHPNDQLLEDMISGKYSVKEALSKHYVIAWITRDEDDELTKRGYTSKRSNWKEAYEECGIEIILERTLEGWN